MAAFLARGDEPSHPQSRVAVCTARCKGVDGEELAQRSALGLIGRSCLCRRGLGPPEGGTIDPHAMQDHREFARYGHLCALGTATLGHLKSPALERREARPRRQQDIGCFIESRANHLIANPRDAAANVRLTRLVSAWRQAEERPGIL